MAQQAKDSVKDILTHPDRLFDLKIPDGFNPEATDMAGMLKWKKGGAEIVIVVGESQYESPEKLFKAIVSAAKKNDRLENVRSLKLSSGHGVSLKQKAPENPEHLRFWRLFAVSKNKVFSLELAAPAKDFDSFASEFEKTLKSFRLRPSDS